MANVQRQFEKFHETIRADYDMNSTLAEKRDIIVDRIRAHLKEHKLPTCERLLQGSYIMKTGVSPVEDLEFDIDVGLRFAITRKEYTAKTVRSWVFDAVNGHTDKVESKTPCIRVTYADGYHVDLVCYAVETAGEVDSFFMAKKNDSWSPADPPKLLEHVNSARTKFSTLTDSATKTDQFRRVVRYLKRWNDVAIPTEREDKPSGLAFTLLCCDRLTAQTSVDAKPDDLRALLLLARGVADLPGRITAFKPTPEYEDMFARLSETEMASLKGRFRTLADTLADAAREPDMVEACKKLQKVFGPDFPVPDPEDSAKKSAAPAIITTSSSA